MDKINISDIFFKNIPIEDDSDDSGNNKLSSLHELIEYGYQIHLENITKRAMNEYMNKNPTITFWHFKYSNRKLSSVQKPTTTDE